MNQPAYLSTLTPLRGIAALLVVVFHVNVFLAPLSAPGQTEFISMGWLWVDFFFVLSGFILTHVYSNYFRQEVTRREYRRFMLARFARIYPLHFVTVCLAVGLIVLIKYLANDIGVNFQWFFDLRTIPQTLLLVQSMGLYLASPLNPPAWSLSTEWWVYLLFPFLVKPFLNLKTWSKLSVFLLIAGLYLVLMYYVAPRWGNRWMVVLGFPVEPTIGMSADFGFFRCVAGFLLGMLFYEVYRQQTGFNLFRKGWVFCILFGTVLIGMHFGMHELLIISLFPLIILAAAYNTDWLKKILNTSPLQRLGDWSFSIYLVHTPLVYVGYCFMLWGNPKKLSNIKEFGYFDTSLGQAWLYCLLLVITTLAVSALLYRFVEVPARQYINKKFKTRTSTPELISVPGI